MTYSTAYVVPSFDEEGNAVSALIWQQTATAGAGGETEFVLPYDKAATEYLKQLFGKKLLRVKSLLVMPTTLAAPTWIYAVLMDAPSASLGHTYTDRYLMTGYTQFQVSDRLRQFNWESLGTTKFLVTFRTTALTAADVLACQIEIEVER